MFVFWDDEVFLVRVIFYFDFVWIVYKNLLMLFYLIVIDFVRFCGWFIL